MTKTVEEVRRDLFESQMEKVLCSEGYSDFSLASMMERGTQGQYYSSRIAGAWEGFNAALDAVEIQLPSERSLSASDDPWSVREWCIGAIEETGLGLRIK